MVVPPKYPSDAAKAKLIANAQRIADGASLGPKRPRPNQQPRPSKRPKARAASPLDASKAREIDHGRPEGQASDSGFDAALWPRLSELLYESSCLFDEQALCALRDIDPRDAVTLLEDIYSKRDGIRHLSAYTIAAVRRIRAREIAQPVGAPFIQPVAPPREKRRKRSWTLQLLAQTHINFLASHNFLAGLS